MVSLDLHDTLVIGAPTEPGDAPGSTGRNGSSLVVTGPFAAGVPTDGSNLVARALALVGRRATVAIDKQIPHGGGLGGGSTDAGAVLRWAGYGTTAPELAAASELGADVPFTIAGGRARVRGIGEVVEALPHLDRVFTLVVPPLVVATPAVYRAYDELASTRRGPDPRSLDGQGVNDLEPAALLVEPRLRWWRDAIAERIGRAPTLAGSGATWFYEGGRDSALDDVIDEGALVVETRTVPAQVGDRRPVLAPATSDDDYLRRW
jgi:4-diphosphocytidyl-2-C-methyl-D-erythritol kinase